MDNWIALVRTNMEDRKVTQGELAERLGMSQGGVGHWLNKRRAPSLVDMNRVLAALGLGYLEVALDIRERPRKPHRRKTTTRITATRSAIGEGCARCAKNGRLMACPASN